ncbi:MAG: lysoplasmalogenase [Nannocystaceae bacterium]
MTPRHRSQLLLGLFAGAAFLLGIWADSYWLRMLSKPVPVLMMILALGKTRAPYSRLLRRGLVACLIGDILLEVSPSTFTAGLIAFLIGHVFYVLAYVTRTRRVAAGWALAFAAYGAGMLWVLHPGLGSMELPVSIYTAAICLMLWRAAAFLGAVAFALSDSLIALNRFHEPLAGVRYPIIVLYWLGQLGITASREPTETKP